jgi:hypothetical protein
MLQTRADGFFVPLACALQFCRFVNLRRIAPVLVLLAAGAVALRGRSAKADDPDPKGRNERCATRLSITLLGKSADAALLAAAKPEDSIDSMLTSPAFYDRLASFVNAQSNGAPAASPLQDPVYFLARHMIEQRKPWRDLYIGAYNVRAAADGKSLEVVEDANGLGYFRTAPWMVRYAGNESEGVRISAAYHMIHDTTGFQVPASVAKPGEDRTATGRKADACKNCHFDSWFALDKAAAVLSRKKVAADGTVTFDPTTITATTLLNKNLASDKDLVATLVSSDAWKFTQCRMVFNFLYGRPENQCEAPLFDKCVDALEKDGTINAALAVVVKDASFCQ